MKQRTLNERLRWDGQKLYLDEILFRVQHEASSDWDGGDDYLRFYKDRKLIDQYDRFLRERPTLATKNIFEIGMFDGGSMVFWNEILCPRKQIGIDLADREDSPYFTKYLNSQGKSSTLKAFWSTDQTDSERLRTLARTEFDGPIDLVIDDASHLYGPTKKSFETLFPFLRPSGLYIIEDWAWDHWLDFAGIGHAMANDIPLTDFIHELIEAAGTSREWISCISVFQGFTVVERGPAPFREDLSVDKITLRRPRPTLVRKSVRALRQAAKKVLHPQGRLYATNASHDL